jgi:hypothetical protein
MSDGSWPKLLGAYLGDARCDSVEAPVTFVCNADKCVTAAASAETNVGR